MNVLIYAKMLILLEKRKGGIHQAIHYENCFYMKARRCVMFLDFMCLVNQYMKYKASSTRAH